MYFAVDVLHNFVSIFGCPEFANQKIALFDALVECRDFRISQSNLKWHHDLLNIPVPAKENISKFDLVSQSHFPWARVTIQ